MTTAAISAITVRRAPRSDPPVDGEPRARHLHVVPDPQLPLELPRRTPTTEPVSFAPQRATARSLPPLENFATGYARAVAEALTGHRRVDVLAPHTTLATMTWIRSLAPATARRKRTAPAPTIMRVLVCEVTESSCEVTALVRRGARVRAMTLRFVGLDRRWQCTHLQVI